MERIEKTFMPIWQPITGGSMKNMILSIPDREEQAMALAAHYYFQARYDRAAQESDPFRNSDCPEIRASALLLHSMANVGLGNEDLALADFAALEKASRKPEDKKMAAVCDVLRYLLAVFFHTDGEIPPVREDYTALLPEGTRLYLLYAVAHALYLERRFEEALGVARSALVMAADRFPPVCVYLNLVASMVAYNLQDTDMASTYFHRAWKIARRENYIQPFVEHHGLLQGQIEKYTRDSAPKEYERISEKVMDFSRGWMKIHNPRSVNKVTDCLTPYEFALAMMAAKGKSNREIAESMNISVNTVKFHLSGIFRKVNVKNRKELEMFLNR